MHSSQLKVLHVDGDTVAMPEAERDEITIMQALSGG
jgi:hypothetical protein